MVEFKRMATRSMGPKDLPNAPKGNSMFQKKFSEKFLDGNDDLAKLFVKKQTHLKLEKMKTKKDMNSSP